MMTDMTDELELQIKNLFGDVIWTGKGKNLYRADLSWADLSGADLRKADLYGAYLRRADLYGANLRKANLRGANLSWANLRGADLYRANLCGADLSWADLGALILLARATRLDGHEYFAWTSALGGMVIKAGCRTWIGEDAIQQARKHCETRTAPKYRAEALRIVAYIEAAWNEHRGTIND